MKESLYNGDTFEHEGFTFKVEFEHDDGAGPPWEESDGYGPVREVPRPYWDRAKKAPGERFLNRDPGDSRCTLYAYDWAEAMKIAKRDGWGPDEEWLKAHPHASVAEKAAAAVRADFNFLAGWLNDDWEYVGVIVTLMVPDEKGDLEEYSGGEFDHEQSLWRVESYADYSSQVAVELAGEIVGNYQRALGDDLIDEMAAAREELEVRAWAERDVVTR